MAHRVIGKREGHAVEALVAAHPEQPDTAGLEEEILPHRRRFALALPRRIAAVLLSRAHDPPKRGLERLHRVDRRRTPEEGAILLRGQFDRQIGLRAGDLRDPSEGLLGRCGGQRHGLPGRLP